MECDLRVERLERPMGGRRAGSGSVFGRLGRGGDGGAGSGVSGIKCKINRYCSERTGQCCQMCGSLYGLVNPDNHSCLITFHLNLSFIRATVL